jgi:hypothetical protein
VADDLGAFARKLDRLEKDLAGKSGAEARMARYGRLGKDAAIQALSSDIGDSSMSGWRRGRPIDLKPAYEVLSAHEVEIAPRKRQRGPWRVLESGRNQGNASGFSGPAINRSTGLTARTKSGGIRKQRGRKASRWNGYTRGKDTWSDARRLMEKRFFRAVHEDTTKVLRKHFGL